jgi:hypothetical protein
LFSDILEYFTTLTRLLEEIAAFDWNRAHARDSSTRIRKLQHIRLAA